MYIYIYVYMYVYVYTYVYILYVAYTCPYFIYIYACIYAFVHHSFLFTRMSCVLPLPMDTGCGGRRELSKPISKSHFPLLGVKRWLCQFLKGVLQGALGVPLAPWGIHVSATDRFVMYTWGIPYALCVPRRPSIAQS